MSRSSQGLPTGYEACRELVGEHDVLIRTDVLAELSANLDGDARAELADLLRRFSADGPAGIPRSKWEGDLRASPPGAGSEGVQLVALISSAAWLYGGHWHVSGRAILVITAVDRRRKNDKATDALRKTAAAEASRMRELLLRQRRPM